MYLGAPLSGPALLVSRLGSRRPKPPADPGSLVAVACPHRWFAKVPWGLHPIPFRPPGVTCSWWRGSSPLPLPGGRRPPSLLLSPFCRPGTETGDRSPGPPGQYIRPGNFSENLPGWPWAKRYHARHFYHQEGGPKAVKGGMGNHFDWPRLPPN